MKKYIDEIMKRIDELIKIYEQYLWKDDNRKLIVGFQKDMMLTFYLYDGDELIDEIYLTFEGKEREFYQVVCLKTFIILLGNVYIDTYKIENGDTLYFNEAIKPYFSVISNDGTMIMLLDSLVNDQEETPIKTNLIAKSTSTHIKRLMPNKEVINQIDKRINLTKERLRNK